MAMIGCGECGDRISDKAAACPQCGNPLSETRELKPVEKVLRGLIGAVCLLLAAFSSPYIMVLMLVVFGGWLMYPLLKRFR